MKFELNGKTYQDEPESYEEEDVCGGCVAKGRPVFCNSLPECKGVIFTEVKEEK